MANLSGTPQAFVGDTSAVDTSALEKLGKRAWDTSGNEYIYLKGVASTGAGSWVIYDEDYSTTLLTANEVGPVAIAMAAMVADRYGWYQIFGINTIAKTDTVAADASLYIDGTAGRVDDLGVTGDIVIGAYSMTADTSNVATVSITYPHVSNDIGASGAVDGSGTANEITYWVDSDTLGALAVATYPSLTELTYVKGVTSAIQTQIDTKAPTASPTFTGTVTIPTPFTLGAVSVTSTGTELNILDGVTATATEINYLDITTLGTGAASKAVVLDAGDDYIWPATGLLTYGGTAITATGAELNILDGATLTVTELNFVDGVTSAIQTQIDGKSPTAGNASLVTVGTITSGVWNGTDIAVADGGTGVSTLGDAGVLIGNGTGAIQVTGAGTSGQVLTSNGAGVDPTFQAAAGGGANEFTFVLTPADAILPNTNFPASGRTVGTTFSYNTLDFDTTTSEAAYWVIPIPPSVTPATHKLTIIWTNAAGLTTETVQWDIDWRSVSDSEVLDAATTPTTVNDTVSDTWLAQGDSHTVTVTLSTATNVVAGDLLMIKISRDVANDNMTGDVKFIRALYEISS